MAKQLNITIEKCEDCPYNNINYGNFYNKCDYSELKFHIENEDIIYKDCPLPDKESDKISLRYRQKLAIEFRELRKKHENDGDFGIADDPYNVITFLDMKGLLKKEKSE
jgi:hypothetical protein